MRTIIKICVLFLFLIISFVYYIPKSHAYEYFEPFTNGTNPLFWQSIRGDLLFGSDLEQTYGIIETNPGTNPFQYLRSNDLFLLKPELKSIYLSVKFSDYGITQGAGYIFSDNVPSDGDSLDFGSYLFYIWPKGDGQFYLFSSICPSENITCDVSSQLSNGVFSFVNYLDWKKLELRLVGDQYEWYLNNSLFFRTTHTNRRVNRVGIGDPEYTSGYLVWPKFYVDYIGLDATQDYSPSPTPTASPSPNPTPTPIPFPSTFPYFSQIDPKWAGKIYDHASLWADLGKQGIDRWGCALSSAAMILKKYEVKTLSGQETTPSTLNEWLRSQPDGYLGNGLINWLAISRYTHQSKRAGKSPTELEFSKALFNSIDVDNFIDQGKYPILGIPGHFVLSYADDGTFYKINDPSNINHISLGKSEPILTSNLFSPSQTDLSYMLYAYDPQMTLSIKDNQGNEVIGLTTEEYLMDDLDGVKESNYLKLLYVPKPTTGDYAIEITNPSDSVGKLDLYFYDQEGKVWTKKIGINKLTQTKFDLKYDRNKVGKNKISHNWKWVFEYIKRWKRWERVWNWQNRWFERD